MPALFVALSLLPLLLFVYLSSHSRLMADDLCIFATGRDLGPLQNVSHWREINYGSYSDSLLLSLAIPLGTASAALTGSITAALWFAGLGWLVWNRLQAFGEIRFRRALAIAITAMTLGATINGFASMQSFYWFIATLRYTLPLALLTLYLAALLKIVPSLRDRPRLLGAAAASALICFLNAGFSEGYVVFQLTFMTLLIILVSVFPRLGRLRRPGQAMILAGWLASLVGFLVQLSAPGVAARRLSVEQNPHLRPARQLGDLAERTLAETIDVATDPEAFAGFILMLAVGLLVALAHSSTQPRTENPAPSRFSRRPLVFGLVGQLLMVPLLWMHTSDFPQVLGRFSWGYAAVAAINVVLILFTIALLWQRATSTRGLDQAAVTN